MIKGIHHTGLVVSDLDKAIAFYQTGDTFSLASRFALENTQDMRNLLQVADSSGRGAMLISRFGSLQLLQFECNEPTQQSQPDVFQSGIRHICVQDRNAHQLFDDFVAAGAGWHARPAGLGTGALYCYIRDPENNILELEGIRWADGEEGRPWYAHTAVVTPDIDRLSKFYETLTGCNVHRRGTFGPNDKLDTVAGVEGVKFHGAWLRFGPNELEFWQYLNPVSDPAPQSQATDLGWSHLCFEVDHLEEEYDRLRAMGIELHAAPIHSDASSMLYGRDPDGNIFGLIELRNALADTSLDTLAQTPEAKALHAARNASR